MPACDHLAFRVHDLERSIRFWEAMLPGRLIARRSGKDLFRTEVAWIEPEGQPGFAVVLIQPTRVRRLLQVFHACVPRAMRSFEHVGFRCASKDAVDERAARAAALGASVLFPPAQVDERVGYIFEVKDPDGNPLEWTFGQSFG